MNKKEEMKTIVYSEPAEYFPQIAKELDLQTLKGVMLGHAVGDALGVPVEFCEREELDENPVTDMTGWGTYPLPEGCFSDDTSMSLATLDSLKKGEIDYEEIMSNFALWLFHDKYTPTDETFDAGRTCVAAIGDYYCREKGKTALDFGRKDERSNGNGSLMRIHPIALYLYFKGYGEFLAMKVSAEASCLTHAHTRSQMACGIYTLILFKILKQREKDSVRLALKEAREYYRKYEDSKFYERLLSLGIESAKREDIRSTGYVVDTLEAAIWCLLNTDSYEECVLTAVNLGDDTDTVAAVAGGLAGAMYGLDGIPKKWLEALKRREYIEQTCKEAIDSWKKDPFLSE